MTALKCVKGATWDTVRDLVSAPIELWKNVSDSQKFLDECGRTPACKRELAFNGAYLTKISSRPLSEFSPAELAAADKAIADVNVGDLLRKREQVREMAMRDRKYQAWLKANHVSVPALDSDRTLANAVVEIMNSKLAQFNGKRACFNAEEQAELYCATLADIGISVTGGVGILKTISRLKSAAKSVAEVESTLDLGSATRSTANKTEPINIEPVAVAPARPGSPAFISVAEKVESTPLVKFMNAEGKVIQETIEPGRSYTALVVDDKLYLGKDMPGEHGKIGGSGSHQVMWQAVFPKLPVELFRTRGGAVRFQPNGTVDISGYHLKRSSAASAAKIMDVLDRVDRSIQLRITPDRLTGLRSGAPVCRAVLEFAKFFWSHHGSSAE